MFLRMDAAVIQARSRLIRVSSRRKEEARPLWQQEEMERTRKVSESRRHRFWIQLWQQANLFQLWESTMGRHQAMNWKIKDRDTGLLLRGLLSSDGASGCPHTVVNADTEPCSALMEHRGWALGPITRCVILSNLPTFSEAQFSHSRMNGWTTCFPVPFSL